MDHPTTALDAKAARADEPAPPTKSEERKLLIFVLVFLAPILVTVLVGGYGFTIWMVQLIFGPPAA